MVDIKIHRRREECKYFVVVFVWRTVNIQISIEAYENDLEEILKKGVLLKKGNLNHIFKYYIILKKSCKKL